MVAGISNLKLRQNHNSFNENLKRPPTNLEEFVDVPFGKKEEYIDDVGWNHFTQQLIDNKLRNSIAHCKTEYNEITQMITYFPKLEGFKRKKKEEITFLEFSCNLLHKFRLLHRLHHLVKMLYVFYYLSHNM